MKKENRSANLDWSSQWIKGLVLKKKICEDGSRSQALSIFFLSTEHPTFSFGAEVEFLDPQNEG